MIRLQHYERNQRTQHDGHIPWIQLRDRDSVISTIKMHAYHGLHVSDSNLLLKPHACMQPARLHPAIFLTGDIPS